MAEASSPSRKTIGEMIDNGIGLRFTRVIILSIPVVGSLILFLGGYAFSQTVKNFTLQLDTLNGTLSKLNDNVASLSDDLVQAKIDIARLQAERERR